jgi:phosphoribosylformylglycinamidine synthase
MLIVAERGREAELQKVFEKWDLHAVVIGAITDDARWRATWRGKVVADIPVRALADEAPMYDRPAAAPKTPPVRPPSIKSHPEPSRALRELLGNPNVGSKKWIYRQYDSLVLSNTIIGPGSDAAVLRIKSSKRGLAMKVDSNPRACALDPYLGTVATVVEAVRNVACAGARPAGITNCLNYGNPQRPEIMWQFTRGIAALRDASLAFKTPVISGNVSFYNETEGRAIPPTPTIAVVGILDDVSKRVTQHFKAPGDYILMVRTAKPSLAASEYEMMYGSSPEGLATIDIVRESRLVEALLGAIGGGLISSAHDVAEGGLGVALAEACFNPDKLLGAQIDGLSTSDAAELFGEGPSTIVISTKENDVAQIRRAFETAGIECRTIGRVSEDPRLRISGPSIDADVNELNRIYESALPGRL